MLDSLFDGWASVGTAVLLAGATYLIVVAVLRGYGETALTRMSAYDFVITIALGSIVATVPLSSSVSLADGAAVLLTYLLLQEGLRFTLKRVPRLRAIVKSQPRLVCWNGELLHERLRALSVPEEEVRAAIRRASMGSIADVQAVVLENDGNWSVIPRESAGSGSALEDVDRGDR